MKEEKNKMTLEDFMNSGIKLEGYIKIQCWEDENCPILYCEGYSDSMDIPSEYLQREIDYIFPYAENDIVIAICIELKEE